MSSALITFSEARARADQMRDGEAKLWPQTERIKAWHALSYHVMNPRSGRTKARERIPAAIAGLQKYFLVEPAGLWRETMRQDGSFVVEPVRASTLYHITCAAQTVSSTEPSAQEQP